MKIWTSSEKGTEKIIAFIDSTIYRGNPKVAEMDHVVDALKTKSIPTENFFGIDLHELLQINLQEGKPYLEILFGRDSYEHFRIKDENTKNEIFNYFKANIADLLYSVERQDKFKAGQKPLIATAVVIGLFLWSLFISTGIEKGNEYDVTSGHYNSFAGLVLMIGSLGTRMVILIFGSLLAIALYSLIRKMNNPPVIHRLTKVRRR